MTKETSKPIILLDLNYTLADNSREVIRQGRLYDVAVERYRTWLIDMIRDLTVLLITVRPQHLKDETLRRIADETGWMPHEAYFNEWGLRAPLAKAKVLDTYVFPKHGRPEETRYLALESNDETAAMYAGHGIPRYRALEVKGKPHLLLGQVPEQTSLF